MQEETNLTDNQKSALAMLSVPGNHACHGSIENMCAVNSAISSDMIFVTNTTHLSCPYYRPFGYNGFCVNPIRKEIYEKYKL